MPARQPFTSLCQLVGRSAARAWADLHIHTVFSDGLYTPAEVVSLARRSGLAAVALADHDTLEGVALARQAAANHPIEVVSGVEITSEHRGREIHLLGYFVRLDHAPLLDALRQVREHRFDRYVEMVARLRASGISLDEEPRPGPNIALGRRHLAVQLVREKKVSTIREAFTRYLGDGGRIAVPKQRLPAEQAIALIRQAGGVAGWAHPSYDLLEAWLAELRDLGLGAVEVEFPGARLSLRKARRLRAGELGLAITGGSDCHGPGPMRRQIGSWGITGEELELLRQVGVRGQGTGDRGLEQLRPVEGFHR